MLITLAKTLGRQIEKVVVVDNGSRDGSQSFLSALQEGTEKVIAVHNARQQHHAGGLRAGIQALAKIEAAVAPEQRTNIYLVIDTDIIFLRSDLLENSLPLISKGGAELIGEIQYDVGEAYVHPSCCLLSRAAYEDPRVWPFVHSGAPALKMQQSMRKAGMKMVNFPMRSDGYIVHRGRGSIAGIKHFAHMHHHSTVEDAPHFHGNPDGELLWRNTETEFEHLLRETSQAEAIRYLAGCF